MGVVSDFRQRNPEEDLRPLAYVPAAQTVPPRWSIAIRVRVASDIASVAAHINDWLRPVDPQLNWGLSNMQAQIHDSESLTLRRPIIMLLASFGGLTLILVIVGVFGVTSYSVAERTREIGIRVPRKTHAPLTLPDTLSTAEHCDQSSVAITERIPEFIMAGSRSVDSIFKGAEISAN